MHELAITESILEISLKHAKLAEASAITDIYIVIGQLSSFVDEAIQMYWDIISADTIALGATLHFRRILAEVRCRNCDTIYLLGGLDFTCPDCGAVQGEILSGDELYVESIEVLEGESHEEAKYSYY